MSAGLQVRNDNNVLQIDGVNQHMVLLRRGVLTTTTLNNTRNDTVASQAIVAQNNGEILAINGSGGYCVGGRYQGNTYLHFLNTPAGSQITYWVFGAYVPSDTHAGMIIWGENGQQIWDTGRPPMRPIGDVSGLGTFTVGQGGKTYALVAQVQYAGLNRVSNGLVGQPNQVILTAEFTAGFGCVNGQTVTVQNFTYMGGAYGPMNISSAPNGWTSNWNNGLQNTYSVLDVTGY